MSILLFEDSSVAQLAPITTARPACCVTAGSYHLLDLLRGLGVPLHLSLRKYLRALMELDLPDVSQLGDPRLNSQSVPTLILNARLVPSLATFRIVEELLKSEQSGSITVDDQLAAVVRPNWSWEQLQSMFASGAPATIDTDSMPALDQPLQLMSRAHDVIAANMSIIRDSLEHRIASNNYQQQADGVFVADGARLGEYLITDTSDGPIIIDRDASIGPYTLLRGPIYIGPGCRILEHAAIKDEVTLGHTTKIGGEVEAAVVEPYTNKQHHGFLGHSYLGSWINLGAGTCNSDLKNTYGTVNMEYPSGKAATGMQFLGCVMGDYSKTAINTGIFTGKVIGVCSMMYGFVTSNVPSFVNYARLFGQMATLPPEVMIATQQRMFSRRKVEQRECDMRLLHDMYRLTQPERDRFGDEIAF